MCWRVYFFVKLEILDFSPFRYDVCTSESIYVSNLQRTGMNLEVVLISVSYMLLIASGLFREIISVRILLSAGGMSAIFYGIYASDLSIALWETGFTVVNLVQLGLLLHEKRRINLTDEERELHRALFSDMTLLDFSRLVRTGTWVVAPAGTVLTRQGETVVRILLISEGAASVEKDTKVVAYCKRGDFVGEMAFVSGNPATASVNCITPTRYLMWRFSDLKRLIEKHPEIRTALQSIFNQNLIEKLVRDNVVEEEQ